MKPGLTTTLLALAFACLTPRAPAAAHPMDGTDDGAVLPPSPRDARALGIGRYVPDAFGRGLSGESISWRSGRGDKLTVLALTSVTCPLCQRFAPSLARIEAAYAGRGVRFVYVNVSGLDTAEAMRGQVRAHGFQGLYLDDPQQAIAAALQARTTTEVFVVDAAGSLLYRGAVSDQYGVGFARAEPRQRFLEDALDAAISGQAPAIPATSSPGCALELPPPGPTTTQPAVTYTREIARLIQANCLECHRAGGVAPFPLDTYEAVARRASMIRTVTEAGLMPPWFAAPTPGRDGAGARSGWANDRSLSRAEREAFGAWVAAGKARGDDADLPLPRVFPRSEWTIGEPDAVFQLPDPITVRADGVMPYQNVLVPTGLARDEWVRGVQIIPSDKAVVHHVLVFLAPESALHDRARRRAAMMEESRGFFAAYVPGNDAVLYPEGFAKRLPAKSVLMFQIHYTPNGRETQDQMKIGFRFAREAPRQVVRTAGIANPRIEIPPGAAHHEEHASIRVPADLRVLAFLPHLHVRGRAFRYEMQRPGQDDRELLLDIPRYDFNWQLRYLLREPLEVPRGSTIHTTAWYDNSTQNPANPDPTKTVRWGPQTHDEMMLGYVEYVLVDEDPSLPEELAPGGTPQGGGAGPRGPSFDRLLTLFDGNRDGRIERREVAEDLHRQFDRLDRNRDGVLDRDDFER